MKPMHLIIKKTIEWFMKGYYIEKKILKERHQRFHETGRVLMDLLQD
jgi:hypothetical protein